MIARRIEFATTDPQYPQFVAVLEDVYVSKHGLIFDRNLELLPDVNFNVRFWPRYTPVHDLHDVEPIARRELEGNGITELPGDTPYVYGMHYFGFYVYGHLWDTLQPLMKTESVAPDDARLLVNPPTDHVNELSRHFALFGYPASKRVEIASLTRVPELWYPSVVCYPGRLSSEGCDWLRRKYVELGVSANGTPEPAQLYLSRNDARGRVTRRVDNNDEVVSLLTAHGFRVIDGSEPLREHIRLFRTARLVTGPHGSMFRNVLFSGATCRVLEFCSNRRLDTSQLEIGQVCGLDYRLMEVPGDEENNISIDLDVLGRWLRSLPIENTRT